MAHNTQKRNQKNQGVLDGVEYKPIIQRRSGINAGSLFHGLSYVQADVDMIVGLDFSQSWHLRGVSEIDLVGYAALRRMLSYIAGCV